jgi:predicted Zn-dependent peptidase
MKKIIFQITLLVILVYGGFANAQKEKPPFGGTPEDFKLPAKKEISLPNGMHSTLVKYGTLPKVNISLIIKTGNIHEAANQVWLADLLARMMNQGTPSMNASALAKKVAGMGGEISINAGSDEFTISASALSEYAPQLIKIIADIVTNPALPASEIERLKNDLKRQLTVSKSVPQSIAQEKFFSSVYGDHPYGRVYPTMEMLNSYTVDDVKNFFDKNIGAKRSVLYVVGNYDEAEVNKAINESFKNWKSGPDVNYPAAHPVATGAANIVDRKGAPQTTVMMGLPILSPKDKDYVAMDITNSLLGGSFASRITSNIRESKGYTYSPFSTIDDHPSTPSLWYEEADITSEHTIDAINEIKSEITKLQNAPPLQDELLGIQRYAAGIFVLQNSSPGGIIGQLNFIDLYGLSDNYLTNHVKDIYAVTPQQVSQLTKKYITPDKMTIVLVGDEASIKEQQAQKPKAF